MARFKPYGSAANNYNGRGMNYYRDYNTDREYDSRKDSWELGDKPLTETQRREDESWRETCRQNRRGGW